MWTVLAVLSAVLLGLYDVAKKKALQKNGVLTVLLAATALSTLFLAPFFKAGPAEDLLKLALKAVLVTASWISGMVGLKLLPLTTVSTIKGSRPVFVVLFSILLFGEHLNWMQWTGIILALTALYLLGHTSRKDGTVKTRRIGFIYMGVSVVTGVASALYDKYIIQGMEPLFVQSWTNLFITVLLAVCILIYHLASPSDKKESNDRFQWDWTLLIVALLITGADALYFFALKQPDALLSVISVIRRGSVIITFIFGAILFKEGNIKAKALNMLLMAAGVVLLLLGS